MFAGIDTLITAREMAQLNEPNARKEDKHPERKGINAATGIRPSNKTTQCIFCKGGHETKNCTSPKTPPKDRFQLAMQEKLCTYCLNPRHRRSECNLFRKRAVVCSKCKSTAHHTLLHKDKTDWIPVKDWNAKKGNNDGANPTTVTKYGK